MAQKQPSLLSLLDKDSQKDFDPFEILKLINFDPKQGKDEGDHE